MASCAAWARYVAAASSFGVIAALAGCSATHNAPPVTADSARPAPAASVTASPAASPAPTGSSGTLAPLTGLPVTAAVASRPAVAVAVTGSDPVGLSSADVIYQEMTSPVRYLAVYQSDEASQVGPVTSTRPTDGPVLSVLHPLTAYDGGTSSFISILDGTKIVDDGYAGHPSLYATGPSGLTVSTSAAVSGTSDAPPPPLFSWRQPGTSLASVRETHPASVRITVPGQPAEQWSFDAASGRWTETSGGPRVSVANVVVQIVSFKTVYLSRKYGQTTQSARVTGTGPVTVFSGSAPGTSGGSAAAGTWAKPGLAAVTNFFDTASRPMSLTPGRTWVVLAPAGTQTSGAGG